MQLVLTALMYFIVIGFASVMAVDFVSGLTMLAKQSALPIQKEAVKSKDIYEEVSSVRVLKSEEMLLNEDPWLAQALPCTSACCFAFAPPELPQPMLLLPPARVHEQPSISKVDAKSRSKTGATVEELRRQCAAAGIKWRDTRGKGKHLLKAEMIAALASLV